MRVAIVSDLIRPNGAGVMALLAADLLTAADHESVVLGGAMPADLATSLDAHHHSASAFTNDERALDGSVTATDHQSFLRAFRRWFAERLREHSPDVVYIHNCGRVFTQCELADLSREIPVLHTMHDEWFFTDAHYRFRSLRTGETIRTFEPGRSDELIEHRYEHLFDVSHRVGTFAAVGPSEWITRRAQQVYPELEILHVPNAVDTSMFELQDRAEARVRLGLPPDAPIVLFVGSPTQERKGFDSYEAALRTVKLSSGEMPIRLVAGGQGSVAVGGARQLLHDGPIADLVDAATPDPVGALGISGPGLVVSGLDRALMPSLYGAADLLVHPSIIDNLPTVPIEAGLCGTRCLATNVGGTAETIADLTDLYPLESTAGELAERICSALEEGRDERIEQRAQRRAAQVDRFAVATHRAQIVPILERLASTGVGNG